MQKRHKAITALLFILPLFPGALSAGQLHFTAENIDVALYPPDTVAVTGEYFFASSDGSALKQRVVYPFPVDSTAGFPFFITVFTGDTSLTVPFKRLARGISFEVDVPRSDTVAVTVTYRQRFGGNTGRYILTTTRYWGRPLVNSRYSLTIPLATTLKYLSYECDTVFTSGSNLVYAFFKKRFMPDRDFIFMW